MSEIETRDNTEEQKPEDASVYSRGSFLATMFLLVVWILFWEP